ncbi:hypothetical protein, partial [Polaromonas sp.]|uniref:hypothetical protein n=1 Tax=Polaromonas sp. TaxID=1869339 RepID=UPI003564CF39
MSSFAMNSICIKTLMTGGLLLLAAMVSGQVSAQNSTQDAENFFRTTHVAGNVHMLEAPDADGNIGVFSGPDGVLLIDDRYDRD